VSVCSRGASCITYDARPPSMWELLATGRYQYSREERVSCDSLNWNMCEVLSLWTSSIWDTSVLRSSYLTPSIQGNVFDSFIKAWWMRRMNRLQFAGFKIYVNLVDRTCSGCYSEPGKMMLWIEFVGGIDRVSVILAWYRNSQYPFSVSLHEISLGIMHLSTLTRKLGQWNGHPGSHLTRVDHTPSFSAFPHKNAAIPLMVPDTRIVLMTFTQSHTSPRVASSKDYWTFSRFWSWAPVGR